MSNPKLRLLQIFDNQRIRIIDVVKKISVSEKYFNSKSAIGSNYLEEIAKNYPEINMDWVVCGRGEMTYVTNKTSDMSKANITNAAANLEKLRYDLKLNSTDFGRYFDRSKTEIENFESGITEPDELFKKDLEKILGITYTFWSDKEYIRQDKNWKRITLDLLNSKRKILNPVYDEVELKKNKAISNAQSMPKLKR